MSINQSSTTDELASWNDAMVKKYHAQGTLFESRNYLLRLIEKNRLKKIIKFLKLKSGERLLDLGCGEGFFIKLLPDNIMAHGIDISRLALAKAEKVLAGKPDVTIKFGNAYATEYPNQFFDKLSCSEVLEHVPEPKKVIKEIHRLLKDGGIAVISVPDEQRIKNIVRLIKLFKIDKFLHAARKQEDYEWHLHSADKRFIADITRGLFAIEKLSRAPAIFGYRFVVRLRKI